MNHDQKSADRVDRWAEWNLQVIIVFAVAVMILLVAFLAFLK